MNRSRLVIGFSLILISLLTFSLAFSGCGGGSGSSGADPSPTASQSPSPSPTSFDDISKSKFGCGAAETTDTDSLKDLGIHWKRAAKNVTQSFLDNGRKTGRYDFSDIDQQVLTNQENQIITYIIINPAKENDAWPDAGDFADYMGRLAERYDGDGVDDMSGLKYPVHNFEICNEIFTNHDQWAGFTDDDYRNYLQSCQTAIHNANADAFLFCGAQVGPPDLGNNNTFDTLIQNGGAGVFDGISYHEYSAYFKIDQTEEYLFDNNLTDKPIFMTETDLQSEYLTDPRPTYAQYCNFMVKSYTYALLQNNVKVAFYTELQASENFPENLQWSALMDLEGNKRIPYYGFKKLIAMIDFFTDGGFYDAGDGVLTCRFDVNGKKVYVIWADSDTAVQLPVDTSGARITVAVPDEDGNFTVSTVNAENGYVSLTAGDIAKYVSEY